MDIEISSEERSSGEQHRSDESNMIQKSSNRKTTWDNNDLKESDTISNARNRCCSCIQPTSMGIIMFAVFTSVAITVGVLTVYFTSPKPNTTCQLAFKRMVKSSIVSSSQPRSVAVGDFNSDHQMDFCVANSGTNTIGIFLSHEDGTFANQQTYSTGSQSRPYSIVVAHFNNDNYLDIAVANYGTNNIGIFFGSGNGTFASQKIFSTGSSRPLFIISEDFNNDHRSDIAVVNYGTNNIGILLGYGNGSFQTPTTYSTGYDSIPYSLAAGDFNTDNQMDIVVANYGTDNIGILLGYGNGSFANQYTYTTSIGSNPSSVAVADFNNDNQLDIVVANYGTGNIGILLGYNNGTFMEQRTYLLLSHSRPNYITTGNFDKDNHLDVVIVDSESDQIHILPGYDNGTFATLTTYDAISGSEPFLVAVADFNKDNRSDIAVVNSGTNNVLILGGYSIKPSARQMNYYLGRYSSPSAVAISDLNNDNHLDLVTNGIVDGVIILVNYGNGTFMVGREYSTGILSLPQYICTGDINNDNQMDIVIANIRSSSVGVLLGQGDGTFANVTTYSTGMDSTPWWIALGDVNNDNRLDIISANTGSSSIGVLLGNGNGTFNNALIFSTGDYSIPYSVAIGDVNNDSHLDIAVADGGGSVVVLLGYGNGAFVLMMTYSTNGGSNPSSIALTDFNSDNHLDIVVANTNTNNVGIYLGYGNGSFGLPTTYSTGSGSQPYIAIVADFNQDHQYDLVVTNTGTSEVVILFGYGNGSFHLARTYSTGSGSFPYGVAVADLNNDKQLEIIVTLRGIGSAAILTAYDAAEFADQTIYSTGSAPQPYSVATGDFNNDNRSDVVVANSGTDNLAVRFGLGNGTFGTQMIYSIGIDSYPQYVIAIDINKDNQLDIVTVNSKNDSISMIIGYGNGSFAAQRMYSTGDGSRPSAIAFADLNNDNRWDFIIANTDTDSIGILLGFNYASFQKQQIYSSVEALTPQWIVVGDFNNDTYQDIVAVFTDSNNIAILLGDGNGSFVDMMTYSTGNDSMPNTAAIGDFNGDRQLDIAVANPGTNNIGILLGYGNGSFATITTYSTGDSSSPSAIAIGDFNNDHQLDIVVANYGTNNIVILLGYGNGTFTTMMTYPTGNESGPSDVTVGDFNRDDRLDIAVLNYDTYNVGIFLGFGNGSFANQMTYSTGYLSQSPSVTVGDFNSDNLLDLAVANSNDDDVGILLGCGNGTFAAAATYSTGISSGPYFVRVADFNNDNHLDIAVANYGANTVVVLFGFGDGSFLLGTAYSTGIGSGSIALAVGNFNKDNVLDIVVVNSLSNTIGVFLGFGSEPYAGVTTYTTGDGSQPHSVAVGDFNNDGRSDVVVANYGTNNIGILLGYGNGSFGSMMTYSTGDGSAPYSVAVGDFNSDNRLDVVVTNSGTDNFFIFLGFGNGTFATEAMYSTGDRSHPYTVVISDFNIDNRSDLAIAISGTNNVLVLYGFGNGTFGNKTPYALGYDYRPYSIAVTDLNQDKWMDIVIACYGTDNIETLMKLCT